MAGAPDSAEGPLASSFAALPDIICAHAAKRPDHAGLIEGDQTLTHGRLVALMNRLAAALDRDGEAVAICARTSINYAEAFCGIVAAYAAVADLP